MTWQKNKIREVFRKTNQEARTLIRQRATVIRRAPASKARRKASQGRAWAKVVAAALKAVVREAAAHAETRLKVGLLFTQGQQQTFPLRN